MNQDVVDKIKKLLRMKRGGTPAEIETALSLARELAAKHGIDLASVNPDEQAQSCRMTDLDALVTQRLQWECKYAALVVQEFFNVSFLVRNPYGRERRLTFVGSSWELEIALHVYRFLVGHLRREWTRRRGRCRNRQAFMYGMYHGICRKLEQGRQAAPESLAAVLIVERALQEREAYLARNYGPLKSETCVPDDDAHKARMLGFTAGMETNIRPGVAGTAAAERKLLS